MNWRFWRKPVSLDHLPAANVEAATIAERESKARLERTRLERGEVERLAERLRALRRENHFADKIQATFSERHE